VGYENCGRREKYPYDQLLDGQPHIVRAPGGELTLRALRYGAARRGMWLSTRKVAPERYEIIARKVS
jgi:hypothetical protein